MRLCQIGAKIPKNSIVENSKNFRPHFYGVCPTLTTMNRGYPDMLQTLDFHILGRKWQFGGAVPPKLGLQ